MRGSISCGAGVAASAPIRDVRGFDGGNARMITCDSIVYQPFQPAGDALACDGVSIQSIVEHAGTPTYIYSARAVRESYRAIDEAFASYPHAIHYALKANSTLALVRLLVQLGSRADANSGGEIRVAERAGFSARDIVFTGVGKTRDELEYAVALGIGYEGRPIIDPVDYAGAVIPELTRIGLPVVLEPGRAVVGYSGALVARVVDTKCFPGGRRFAVLDAGMGELIRPALYGSFHRIVPVVPRAGAQNAWDIVGPICESSDVFARDRLLPPLQVDDLVAILDAGAYGSVMGSNYNRHLLPAEVLVDEGQWTVIRRRQTLEDVLALES